MNKSGAVSISIESFNTRGLRNRLGMVHELAKRVPVLRLCQTWMRASDRDLQQSVDVHANTERTEKYCRGFGGVAIIIIPNIPFEEIDKVAPELYQSLTV